MWNEAIKTRAKVRPAQELRQTLFAQRVIDGATRRGIKLYDTQHAMLHMIDVAVKTPWDALVFASMQHGGTTTLIQQICAEYSPAAVIAVAPDWSNAVQCFGPGHGFSAASANEMARCPETIAGKLVLVDSTDPGHWVDRKDVVNLLLRAYEGSIRLIVL